MRVFAAVFAASCFAACSGGSADVVPTVVLALDDGAEGSVAGDGLKSIALKATVTPRDAIVTFAAAPGLVTASNVKAADGVARVVVLAPFEAELGGRDVAAVASATVRVGEAVASDELALAFTVPTEGPPLLFAHAVPDRVVAGSGQSTKIILRGQRLAETETATATITTDVDGIVALPDAITLAPGDAAPFYGEVDVVAPDAAGEVVVTVAAGGASASVTLFFVAEGEAVFDLSGDFVQVAHGVTFISDFFLLDGDQCAVASSISLARIRQDGAHLTITSEACSITMPAVRMMLLGTITPTVGPSFIRAANEAGAEAPLDFDLDSVGPASAFAPPPAQLAPLVVGADLDDPRGDALPTDSSDPRVNDADGDGHPGVTINAGGARYTAYRSTITEMTGTIESSNVIEGSLVSETESVIYDDPLGAGGPRMTPKPSPFRYERLDGKFGSADYRGRDGNAASVSCADVQAWVAEQLRAVFPAPDAATACR